MNYSVKIDRNAPKLPDCEKCGQPCIDIVYTNLKTKKVFCSWECLTSDEKKLSYVTALLGI